MMTHTNNNRLTVEVGDKWRLYTNTLPDGAEAIGTVSRGGDVGALVKLSSGKYAQIKAGVLRILDGRKVVAALGTAGRPPEMDEGRKVNTYLDAKSIAIAAKLGNGNVSHGIRRALNQFDEYE
jgi:hypothetical protein